MTYAETIQFLYSLRWFGAKLGLENTLKLAALAGNPQHQLRFIHVAGTNGKGSTCAMLESIYRAASLRVGLFTSPHLISFRERLQVNRQLISEGDVVRLVDELQPWLKQFPAEHHPTFFEALTVLALRYFAEQKCDLVIWETGLGGRLDATNIVTPLASVITNIGLDHQQWLGDTLAKIAFEKAGIIKPGVPVLTATNAPEALAVIVEVARDKHSPLTVVSADDASCFTSHASLSGPHQQLNAALAVATVQTLQPQLPVRDEQICAGLARVNWPGRMQWITRATGQRVLLDGAHNVAGAEALRAALLAELRPSSSDAHSEQEPGSGAGILPAQSGQAGSLPHYGQSPDPVHGHKTRPQLNVEAAHEPERLLSPSLSSLPDGGEGVRRTGERLTQGMGANRAFGMPQSRSETGVPLAAGAPLTLILGVLADKDWRAICKVLAPLAARIRLVAVGSERTADPVALAAACRAANPAAEVSVCETLAVALTQSEREPVVVITGSLYLVGAALEQLGSAALPSTDEKALNDWQPKVNAVIPAPLTERDGRTDVQSP